MANLLLLSGLVAPVVIPAFLSRGRSPAVALKRTIVLMLAFNLFYVGVLMLYPRLVFR